MLYGLSVALQFVWMYCNHQRVKQSPILFCNLELISRRVLSVIVGYYKQLLRKCQIERLLVFVESNLIILSETPVSLI